MNFEIEKTFLKSNIDLEDFVKKLTALLLITKEFVLNFEDFFANRILINLLRKKTRKRTIVQEYIKYFDDIIKPFVIIFDGVKDFRITFDNTWLLTYDTTISIKHIFYINNKLFIDHLIDVFKDLAEELENKFLKIKNILDLYKTIQNSITDVHEFIDNVYANTSRFLNNSKSIAYEEEFENYYKLVTIVKDLEFKNFENYYRCEIGMYNFSRKDFEKTFSIGFVFSKSWNSTKGKLVIVIQNFSTKTLNTFSTINHVINDLSRKVLTLKTLSNFINMNP